MQHDDGYVLLSTTSTPCVQLSLSTVNVTTLMPSRCTHDSRRRAVQVNGDNTIFVSRYSIAMETMQRAQYYEYFLIMVEKSQNIQVTYSDSFNENTTYLTRKCL